LLEKSRARVGCRHSFNVFFVVFLVIVCIDDGVCLLFCILVDELCGTTIGLKGIGKFGDVHKSYIYDDKFAITRMTPYHKYTTHIVTIFKFHSISCFNGHRIYSFVVYTEVSRRSFPYLVPLVAPILSFALISELRRSVACDATLASRGSFQVRSSH
jgi:hypothetical protein